MFSLWFATVLELLPDQLFSLCLLSELVFQYTCSHSWLDVLFRFNKLVLSWIIQVINYNGIVPRTGTPKTPLDAAFHFDNKLQLLSEKSVL